MNKQKDMNYLKGISRTLLMLVIVLVAFSCDDDDEGCTAAPDISTNIIGSWTIQPSQSVVEFKADGTLIDEDDALVFIIGSTPDSKSYSLNAQGTVLTAIATGSSGGETEFEYDVTTNECNRIVIDASGTPFTLTRR